MRTVIYAGTFDPFTNGHIDLVQRASQLFDKVIIAVARNEKKSPMFSMEERVDLCEQVLKGMKGIEVCGFAVLLGDFARQHDATILRGLRAVSDFEYEFQLANMNRAIYPDVETVFLTPADHLSYISSSLVKEIASLGGDVGKFVPKVVNAAVIERFAKQNALPVGK